MDPEGLDQSYPPALLAAAPRSANRMRVRGAPTGGSDDGTPAGAGGTQASSPRLRAAPGGYVTPVRAADRPRNVTELAERVDPVDAAPWPRGASIPVGGRGKVAHWTGSSWKGGESPGYPAAAGAEVSATGPAGPPAAAPPTVEMPAAPPAPGRHAAGPQFPGDQQPGDMTR